MSLTDHLRRRIAVEGPLSVQDVMADALTHPTFGYYATRDPFGVSGDFITAPEISQMFGELIGLWAAVVWQQIGAPAKVRLVELGPGRGTLMADAMRAAGALPDFTAATEIHLVEVSATLRSLQARALEGFAPTWHADLSTVPDGPTIVIANEFFDALPILQLVRAPGAWCERRLAMHPESGDMAWVVSARPAPQGVLVDQAVTTAAAPGDVAELCPAGLSIAREIARRLVDHGGAAVVVDYGYAPSAPGDTLQAVRGHQPVPVLETLGAADLTSHVDFAALGRVVSQAGGCVFGPTTQAQFLTALGIDARADRLMAGADAPTQETIAGAKARLIGPDEMGTLFKVAAWTGPGAPAPPGFESGLAG